MTNFNVTDLNTLKNMTAVKKTVSNEATDALRSLLVEAFGEDNVKFVDSNTLGVRFNSINDSDGFAHDVCFTVHPTVKDYVDRKTTTKTFEAFDLDTEANIYAQAVKEKADKEAEQKVLKEAKIKADKEAREAKKAAKA